MHFRDGNLGSFRRENFAIALPMFLPAPVIIATWL
jgi:hypothetical protein